MWITKNRVLLPVPEHVSTRYSTIQKHVRLAKYMQAIIGFDDETLVNTLYFLKRGRTMSIGRNGEFWVFRAYE
mgnify:FL=1